MSSLNITVSHIPLSSVEMKGVADVGEQPVLIGIGGHGGKQKKIAFPQLISIYLSISGKCTNAFWPARDGKSLKSRVTGSRW